MGGKSEAEAVVDLLKTEHPKIFEELLLKSTPTKRSTPTKSESKTIPKGLKREALKEAKKLENGINIKVPVLARTLIAAANISWDYDDVVYVEITGFTHAPNANNVETLRREKKLAKLFSELVLSNNSCSTPVCDYCDRDQIYGKVYRQVCNSREYKDFAKSVKEFNSRMHDLSCKYDFDVNREIFNAIVGRESDTEYQARCVPKRIHYRHAELR